MTRLRPPALALALTLVAFGCSEGGSQDAGAPSKSKSSAADDGRPVRGEIAAETQVHDFGTVLTGTLQEWTFPFEASGDAPLIITELRHSCDCTEGKLYVLDDAGERGPVAFGEPYAIGTRFELDTTLNTLGKMGQQHQAVHVMLEGIGRVESFTLDAVIETYLVAEPQAILAEAVSPFDGLDEAVELRARHGGRFAMQVDKAFQCDDVEVELTPQNPDDDGRAEVWTMSYRLRPTVSDRTDKCRLIFVTDVANDAALLPPGADPEDHAFYRFEYRTQVQISPVMKAWPSEVDFARVNPNFPATRRFTIRSADPDFEMEAPRIAILDERRDEPYAAADAVQVSATQNEEGDWEIEMRIEELTRPGPFKFRVAVELGHPLQRDLVVTVRGFGGS